MSLFRSRLALSSALAFLFAVPILAAEEPGFTPLFNGKDLSGWEGDPALWSVQDGAITGVTTDGAPLPYNKFLIWRGGTVKNFELHAKVRQAGNNSGIQYRSRELKEVGPWSVGGYQCDIHPLAVNNAMLYDERGRGIVAMNGQSVIVDEKGAKWLTKQRDPVTVDVAEWNEYTIIARGNQLTHKLNGQVTVEIIDHQADQRELEGILAIQVHRGPAMRVQIKDVMLKTLPDGGVLSPAEAPVPPDAKPLGKPATPKKAATRRRRPQRPAARSRVRGAPGVTGSQPRPPAGRAVEKAAAKAQREAAGDRPGDRREQGHAARPDQGREGLQGRAALLGADGEQGSWVNLCLDDKGRIIASDQYGGLYRFPPPPPGQPLDPATIEKVPAEIRAVERHALGVRRALRRRERLREEDRQRPLPHHRLRRRRPARQGRTAPRDGGPGRSRRACRPARARRQVALPRHRQRHEADGSSARTRVPPHLGRGSSAAAHARRPRLHARCARARRHHLPRLARRQGLRDLSPSGFRNIFDAAFNHDGELFTYDADMEYDFNTSWYRPTRICHVVSGSEFGWRNGAGKRPEWYPDNLPAGRQHRPRLAHRHDLRLRREVSRRSIRRRSSSSTGAGASSTPSTSKPDGRDLHGASRKNSSPARRCR